MSSRSYQRFVGKTGVVTGAGMGIGAAVARALAGEGASVVIVDLDPAAARSVASEITGAGGQAVPVVGSVSVAADAERAVRTR